MAEKIHIITDGTTDITEKVDMRRIVSLDPLLCLPLQSSTSLLLLNNSSSKIKVISK
jgi:hypothetical protein